MPVDGERAVAVLGSARRIIPQFEERPEQQAMLRAVAHALNGGEQLLVEAGTGTGKSLAYLIPAALYALANDRRVVVSTATINLQEQLIGKDIPALQSMVTEGELHTAILKGRRHYLCLRRFTAHQAAGPRSDDEAKFMARLLIWLVETETGDRTELNLSSAQGVLWPRLSAEGTECGANCPFVVQGTCFLWRAHRRAEAAHLLVINHALLLSDVAVGGHLLPPYDDLVVDEAHHLEEEATRQMGFSARQHDILGFLERCGGLAPVVQGSVRGVIAALGPGAHLTSVAVALAEAAQRARPRLQQFADTSRAFLRQQVAAEGESAANGGYDYRLLIDGARRVQPDWWQVETAWENLRLVLAGVLGLLENLGQGLAQAGDSGLLNRELLVGETEVLSHQGRVLLEGLAAAIAEADPQRIVWLEEDRRDGALTVAWVPLEVAEILRQRLFAGKNAIVFTGATLAAPGAGDGFEYIQQRLGLDAPRQLLLGSSFDYRRAALVLVPRDMPEPNERGYLETMAQVIADLARATQGRALALFTAHSALRAAWALVRAFLEPQGIAVLGQEIDGTPQQLLRSLRSNPRAVLLGTASLWEGVDVAGETLSLLIIARLPFSVPTEPIFAARAALYDDPFSQYALPQAILRFKQGFGRLIRSRTDRGVVIILDRRVLNKGYGRAFLGSLPSCPLRQVGLAELPDLAVRWLDGTYGDDEETI
jgi:DNA polymerase-3 subunit epsilon/ATP-dependent DNA helicase DinG